MLEFEVDEKKLLQRIQGRRVCLSNGRSYHVEFNPPKVEGIDDETGEPLIWREDDRPASFIERMKVYHESTIPILNYYRSLGKLKTLDATASIAEVQEQIKDVLRSSRPRAPDEADTEVQATPSKSREQIQNSSSTSGSLQLDVSSVYVTELFDKVEDQVKSERQEVEERKRNVSRKKRVKNYVNDLFAEIENLVPFQDPSEESG